MKVPSTSAESVPRLQRFQTSILQGMDAALWGTMRKYNINANLVRAIEHLYGKAISAVQMNCNTGEWFRTAVGVREGLKVSAKPAHGMEINAEKTKLMINSANGIQR